MGLRWGKLAVSIEWYGANPWFARWAWGLHKWRWRGESSWRHGAAYLGKIRVVW